MNIAPATVLRRLTALVVLAAAVPMAAGVASADAKSKLVISEFRTQGSGGDFLELLNVSNGSVSLANYQIDNEDAAQNHLCRILQSGQANVTLQPGQHYLLADTANYSGSGNATADRTFQKVASCVETGLYANGGLSLYDAVNPGDSDMVAYGTAPANHPMSEGGTVAPIASNGSSTNRKSNGRQDTDSNGADFQTGAAEPENHNVVDPQDSDGDGVADPQDNCPANANADQHDTDADGLGDVCDADDDNDGVVDATDNCPITPNADQVNTDGDGQGDACDPDDDNDAVLDAADDCAKVPDALQLDSDKDGKGNACDDDDDNDGIVDGSDNCPLTPNPQQADVDHDAIGDACDPDVTTPGDPEHPGTPVPAPAPGPQPQQPPIVGPAVYGLKLGSHARSVSFTAPTAELVTFTVKRRVGTRLRTVRGTFSAPAAAGRNQVRLRRLAKGSYRLIATPATTAGVKGPAASASFRVAG